MQRQNIPLHLAASCGSLQRGPLLKRSGTTGSESYIHVCDIYVLPNNTHTQNTRFCLIVVLCVERLNLLNFFPPTMCACRDLSTSRARIVMAIVIALIQGTLFLRLGNNQVSHLCKNFS